MRLSEQEYQDLMQRMGVPPAERTALQEVPQEVQQQATAKGIQRPFRGNKTEAAYMALLEARKRSGEVVWYGFEAVTLKLADDTRYTPDFAVILADMTIEMHEVKGFWRDDARVKIKVAAAMFPFRFFAVKKEKGGAWSVEKF